MALIISNVPFRMEEDRCKKVNLIQDCNNNLYVAVTFEN